MAFHADGAVGGSHLSGRVTVAAGITGHTALLCATEPLEQAGSDRLRKRSESVILNCRWLILDLHAAEFIDSDGVRMLIDLAQTLEAKGSELLLVVPSGSRVERTIRLLRLENRLQIFPRLDDAWAVQRLLVGIEN